MPVHRFAPLVFGLLLACPLFAWPGYGYDGVRLPAVLALAALLMGRSAWSAARRGERSVVPDPVFLAGLLLLAAQALSLAAARTPWEGASPLLVLAAGVSAYASARGGLLPRAWVFGAGVWIVCGVGLLFAGCGIGQHLAGGQAVSTEGNRNYAGALASMLLPAALAFAFIRAPAWKRALALAAASVLLVHLAFTESRAGLAGAMAGCAAAGVVLAVRRVRNGAIAAGLGLLLLVGAAAVRGKHHLSEERARTAGVRLEIWRSSLRMFADRPWLGAGLGNFAVEYPPYRSEAEFLYHQEQAGPDFKEVEDPHSTWVQAAVEAGVPGIVAGLLLLVLAGRQWVRYVRAAPDPDYAAVLAGLGGGAAAFLVAGLFNTLSFRASPTLLFFAFLGLIELAGNPREWEERRRVGSLAVAMPAAAALALAFGFSTALMLAGEQRGFIGAMGADTPGGRIHLLRLTFPRTSWRVHYELARAYDSDGRPADAVLELRESLRKRPYHLPTLNNLAVCLLRQRLPGGEAEAETLLREAVRVGPSYYLSHFNLGSLLLARHPAAARSGFQESARLHPRHAPSHFSLGEAHLLVGEPAAAVPHFRRAAALGLPVGRDLRAAHPEAAAHPLFAEFLR